MKHSSARKFQLARSMQLAPTPGERRMWELVRARRWRGLKFRRRHPVGGFIVDFFCAELRLAIEVDGSVHDDSTAADADRTLILNRLRIAVIRVRNEDVSPARLDALLEPYLRSPAPFHGAGVRG